MRFSLPLKFRILWFVMALMICVLGSLFPVGKARAEGGPVPLKLEEGRERYEIGTYLQILEDPESRWTIEDVATPDFPAAFSPLDEPAINLGITNTTVWLRFRLSESLHGPRPVTGRIPWLLDIGWPFFDSTDVYLVRPGAAGEGTKIENVRFDAGRHHFHAGISEQNGMVTRMPQLGPEGGTLYLRLHTDGVFFLHPVICTVKNYLETSILRMLWFGIYFGVLLSLLLYNLFLFFCLRDRSYLWYVASIGTIGLYFLGTNRLTFEYLTDFPPQTAIRLVLGFLSVSMVALLLFVRAFLQTPTRALLLDRFIRVAIVIQVLILIPVPFASIAFLNQCYSLAGFTLPLLINAAALICWYRGYRPARFLVFSWMIYGLCGIIYILTFRGVLPFSELTFHSFQIGSAIEAILLSFALADRINLLRREREELSYSERHHKELALTDALTGLHNLRYFKGQINIELELAESRSQPLTLMMLDIDNFKALNDKYGHQEGDRVLVALGKAMASCIRERDVACRYGGEEFAIILPGGRNSIAIEIYERINAEIGKFTFGTEEKPALVTFSIGVAELLPEETAENLIRRADQALYEAKARGRNQIVVASREPAVFFSCFQEELAMESQPASEA